MWLELFSKQTPCGSILINDHLPYVDCKTVGFFRKISEEIGKAWRESLTALFVNLIHSAIDFEGE